jgi:FkbH-like protein
MAANPSVPSENAIPAPPRVVLAATFTVNPLVDSLSYLLRETSLALHGEVAPYGQVFQELLDPSSCFARNRDGVNVVLIRFEDWLRGADGTVESAAEKHGEVERNVADLGAALRGAAASTSVPIVLSVCPPSPALAADTEAQRLLGTLEDKLRAEISSTPGVRVLSTAWAAGWEPKDVYDPEGDRLGHVPYTRRFFAGLGLALARLIHAIKSPPMKVLVLDCDNTLWKGIVGEDGVSGIEITERYRQVQEFLLEKKHSGMILSLASKNAESDVLEVFQERKDMVLRADDIVAMRVNWLPKSENIRALAAELNLGLDSFVFVDDNPIECAEVEAACPAVLVLRLPIGDDDDPATFLRHVWPLDILDVTDEDRRRSEMYRENLDRSRFSKTAGNLTSFLAGLDLRIAMTAPTASQLARVAQLTQRTNQFNFTTRRRNEAEVEQLAKDGKDGTECRVVEVRDRFGDYGLVGVVIFTLEKDALVVDTFLLSCRVLGRGVEHAMLRELGKLAKAAGKDRVELVFVPTKKNLPARNFLDSLDVDARDESADGLRVVLSTERACTLTYAPGDAPVDLPTDEKPKASPAQDAGVPRSQIWNRLARVVATPESILAILERESRHVRAASKPAVPPRTETERRLASIWADILGVSEVGVDDDYTSDLCGTSLLAVSIFARTERELGVRLPLVALVETPTIAGIAARIDRPSEINSLVLLNQGGGEIPLFLVHDADGETLLYRNLAQRLEDRPVYGIQPHGRPNAPIVHTRIRDMAAHYVAEIRKVRSHGPYLLGGLCAGGVVAYEMALQLEDMGERARLVAVFDAADVEAQHKPHLDSQRRLGRVREVFSGDFSGHVVRALAAKIAGYAVYQVRSRAEHVWSRMSVATLRLCLDRDLPLPVWARRLGVRKVYNAAEAEYCPRRPLREEILLFRATEGEGSDEPYVRLYSDPLLGWGKRSVRGTRAFDVPGGHGSMLQEPHVAATVEILRSYLASASLEPMSGAAGGAAA